MGDILNSVGKPAINYSDSFKVWIDKFNDIVDQLQTTDFAIEGEYVTVDSQQQINGEKTFNNDSYFTSNVVIGGNLNVSGGLFTSNNAQKILNFTYSVDGNINFIGKNGIRLSSNQTAPDFNLSFTSPTASSTLNLNFGGTSGIFKIKDNILLEIEKSEIKLGSDTWNFPSLPTQEASVLTCSASKTLSWATVESLATDLAASFVASTSLINAVELMPVGTIINVDTTKASQWEDGLDYGHIPDDNFFGWIILNGQTIRSVPGSPGYYNPDFAEIIKILANDTNATSTQLEDSTADSETGTVKLIKYRPDAVSTFSITRGNGISFFNTQSNTSANTVNLKTGNTRVELNILSDDFEFSTSGQLKLKSNVVRTTSTNNSGNIITNEPTADNHAATKGYVDSRITANGAGSILNFTETIDNISYSDKRDSFSLVDRDGAGRVYRTSVTDTPILSAVIDTDNTLNCISSLGANFGKVTKLKKSISTPDQFFFVDDDDVIYGYGDNTRQDIAAWNRGIGEFSSYYRSGFFLDENSGPYNFDGISKQIAAKTVQTLLPAFLPIKERWSANVVLFDKVTGVSGSSDKYTNLTIKTKDGYDNAFVNPDNPSSGLVNYLNTINNLNIPYTRGYYISTGLNNEGQLGNGIKSSASASSPPQVWGPGVDQPGRILWYNFALTEVQKADLKKGPSNLPTLINNNYSSIRKRFNWFKPNSITDGGLKPQANDALAEWRLQTGLNNSEPFTNYSWYIKKVVRTYDAHYVIVGKPGNESDNEVWCSGKNRFGSFGNLSGDGIDTGSDFSPMYGTDSEKSTIAANTFTYVNPTVTDTTAVHKRQDGNPHGLLDFDCLVLNNNTTKRYVVLGDTSGENRLTQFRVFETFVDARSAFISNSTTGAKKIENTTKGLASTIYRHTRLKGIVDIISSRMNVGDTTGDGLILRQVLNIATNNIPNDINDSIPEEYITSDRVLACGANKDKGRLGVGQTSINLELPTVCQFEAQNGLRAGNKIVKMATCNFTNATVLLTNANILYFSGNRASGFSNNGNTGNTTKFTNVGLANVHDFFIIDDDLLARIFIITKSTDIIPVYDLYAGGTNTQYILGTSRNINKITPKYAKIIFPENPKNITNISGAMYQTYILCKNEGDKFGRLYATGNTKTRSYFPPGAQEANKLYSQFKKVDHFIL